jgi:hypothetical protein
VLTSTASFRGFKLFVCCAISNRKYSREILGSDQRYEPIVMVKGVEQHSDDLRHHIHIIRQSDEGQTAKFRNAPPTTRDLRPGEVYVVLKSINHGVLERTEMIKSEMCSDCLILQAPSPARRREEDLT